MGRDPREKLAWDNYAKVVNQLAKAREEVARLEIELQSTRHEWQRAEKLKWLEKEPTSRD